MINSEIERFYDNNTQKEWERLDRHRMEFAITLKAFNQYLPSPPIKILDIGGGPGRYSITLSKMGHRVTLVDLSLNCLKFARVKAEESEVKIDDYVQCNAIELPMITDESFDSVLLMGPLYHLLKLGDRKKAVREAYRVLKRGGLIFTSFITQYAPIRWVGKYEPEWIINNKDKLHELLNNKFLIQGEGGGFTSAYFAHPSEIKPLLETASFTTIDMIACEGLLSMIEEKVNEIYGELWDAWVELNYKLAKDSSIFGCAEHILYIGRK